MQTHISTPTSQPPIQLSVNVKPLCVPRLCDDTHKGQLVVNGVTLRSDRTIKRLVQDVENNKPPDQNNAIIMLLDQKGHPQSRIGVWVCVISSV